MINIRKELLRTAWDLTSPGGELEVQDKIDNPAWRPYQSNYIWYGLRSDVWNRVEWLLVCRLRDYFCELTFKFSSITGRNYGKLK